jgi:tetratricopeptide (TPR) repeat protein
MRRDPSSKCGRRAARVLSVVLPLIAMACQSPDSAPAVRAERGGPGQAVAPPQQQPPVKLVDGLGPVHHAVSTAEPEAQKFFDQGLAYLYAFNHPEADRSFARAADIDPKLAMAWWGRALVLGPNYNLPEIDPDAHKAAIEAVKRAQSLVENATPAERAYINAVAKRYPADPKGDWAGHAREYKEAMGELSRRFAEDLDAQTLYAESAMNLRPWRLYEKDGTPAEGTEEIVRVLEWVIARNPNHTGANHYYIHATEASTRPGRALAAARRLPKLAPSAGHLVHMPAHVYSRIGDYAAAISANADAARADEAYIACCGPKGGFYPMMYYSHNLHFLAFASAMAGRSKEAAESAARLAAHIEPGAHHAPMLDGFAAMPILITVRQGQWADVNKAAKPKDDRPATLAAWHFARGMARADTKDVGPALQELDALKAVAPGAREIPMGNNKGGDVFQVAEHYLAGRIAGARGDAGTARRELESAVQVQDGMAYDEPPAFPWPVREALGAQLLRAGDAAGAEKVFREDLVKTPNNPRSLFGLAESLKAAGRHADAAEARKRFDAAWAGADRPLSLNDL